MEQSSGDLEGYDTYLTKRMKSMLVITRRIKLFARPWNRVTTIWSSLKFWYHPMILHPGVQVDLQSTADTSKICDPRDIFLWNAIPLGDMNSSRWSPLMRRNIPRVYNWLYSSASNPENSFLRILERTSIGKFSTLGIQAIASKVSKILEVSRLVVPWTLINPSKGGKASTAAAPSVEATSTPLLRSWIPPGKSGWL